MKRALSLILVLAMVLCLVPFSAFAEGEVWGTAEDYKDGTIIFTATSLEASALYTAPEAGTVKFELTLPEGATEVNIFIDAYADENLYVSGTEIAVEEGTTFDVIVVSENFWTGEVSISHTFTAVPGTVNNPYDMSCSEACNPTVILMPNESVYYNLYGAKGKNLQVVGAGVKANFDGGEFYTGDEMIEVFIEGEIMEGFYVPVLMKLTNKSDTAQYYKVYANPAEAAIGSMDRPHYIEETEVAQTGAVAEGSQGYYYTYYPEDYGTATISVAATDAEGKALGWTYSVNNVTAGKYGDTQFSDNDPVVNAAVIEVSPYDEIEIMVNTYDAANPWGPAPAGNVSVTVSFEADPVVAVYNETEYKRLEDALQDVSWAWPEPSAEAPAVITLIGDAEVDSILELDAYITLDLADYTLTAPNVLAYADSVLTGNVGTAAINSTYVVADNLTIDGVEYAWTANEEGVYTLAEYEAPVAEDTEPEVASYNGETMGLNAAIAAAAADYALDGDANTVELIADADYTGKTVTVPEGVTLDLVTFDLTVEYLNVLNGGYLYSSIGTGGRYAGDVNNAAVLNIARNNLVFTNDTAILATSTMSCIPVWLSDPGCYAFINTRLVDDASWPFTLDQEANTASYGFKNTGPSAYYNLLKDNGGSDHGIKICLSVEWETTLSKTELTFWYTDAMNIICADDTSQCYTFGIGGLENMSVKYDTFKLKAVLVTDCGVCVFGPSK